MLNNTYPFQLPPLIYSYEALEPYIDAETMHYHHDKHFQTYIDNLNKALEPYPQLQNMTLVQLLKNGCEDLPEKDCTTIMNNAGGVYNHSLFFEMLQPAQAGNHMPDPIVSEAINEAFGSFDNFKAEFEKSALSVFGSGWTYLVIDRQGKASIVNLKNQDTLVTQNLKPIILFDVWEHAYYLKYKNRRVDYVKNLWNVIRFAKSE